MTHDTVITKLMERYDKQFPQATEFERGTVQAQYRRTLDDLDAVNLIVSKRRVRVQAGH